MEICSAARRPLTGASRFCQAEHRVPDPATDPAGFTNEVSRLIEAREFEMVLPMTDVSAMSVLRLRETHPDVIIPFPDVEAYETISDKRRLAEVARELGVPVPKTWVLEQPPESADRLGPALEEIGLPTVIKPARSVVRTPNGLLKVGVTIATSEAALSVRLAEYPAEAYPILLQEKIVGPGLGAFMLCDEGRPIASFGHERLREKPPTGGVSVYRRSVALRDDVRALSTTILEHFRWSGVAMVEFKEDRATGTPYLMEVNGRFWGSLQLAIDAGVDFPEILVRMFSGADPEPAAPYELGVRSRWLWGDVDHLVTVLKAPWRTRQRHPDFPGRLSAIGRFLLPWRPGDRWEVLRLGDPKPFFRESANWFRALRGSS